MKRKQPETILIDTHKVENLKKKFKNSDNNKLSKNIITNVGLLNASTDHGEVTKVSHTFLNTIKKKNLKATNQGASGRCWLFSGLNIFRHNVIKALELENFEFSETYLFFWDKFERSNSYLNWMEEYLLKNDNIDTNDRLYNYFVEKNNWMSDGGYWNFFANLVDKYGLIPKEAMPETFQSEYSDDMNEMLIDTLHSATIQMKNNKNKIFSIKNTALENIFCILVKFLGEPPNSFQWNFTNENGDSTSINKLTPFTFREMVIPDIKMEDFVLLSNIPSDKFDYYKKYSIKYTSNVLEKKNCETINIPMKELKLMTKKSILSGMPVWFAGDVGKSFHPFYSTLNTKIVNTDLLLNKGCCIDKKDRLFLTNQKTTHAMTFTGVNLDSKGNTISWQVENSWGFCDNEIPGMDGFLCMDDNWFNEYLGQVVIHKKFLTRKILKILETQTVTEIDPWDSVAPALKVQGKKYYNMNLNLFRNINKS